MIRHPQGMIAARIAKVGEDRIVTSIVVAGELRFGAERRRSVRLTTQMEAILRLLPVLPLADDADAHYGPCALIPNDAASRSAAMTC